MRSYNIQAIGKDNDKILKSTQTKQCKTEYPQNTIELVLCWPSSAGFGHHSGVVGSFTQCNSTDNN